MSAVIDKILKSAKDTYYDAIEMVADGDLTGAVSTFRSCLAENPSMLDTMLGLIRALKDLGELDEAIRGALQLAEVDPDDVLAHTSLSILYQTKGMIAEAEAEATKAKLLGWKLHCARDRIRVPRENKSSYELSKTTSPNVRGTS